MSTGIPCGTPVIAGSADHVASALSAGIVRQGDLLIKFGGAGDILYCTEEINPSEHLFFDYADTPGKYLLSGCMAASGSLVKWFLDRWYGSHDSGMLKELDIEASKIPAGSDGLIVLPYFLGEKTPIFDPIARGVFFGLTLSHNNSHIFRAILESVVYGFRHHLDVFHSMGYVPDRIFATNGGAKSKFWCQVAADILNRKIRSYPAHTGSSLGVAFTAGMAVGSFGEWEDIRMFLTKYEDYEPIPENAAVYDKTYAIYRDLYERLKPLFGQTAEIYKK